MGKILRYSPGLVKTVVLGIRVEADRVVVSARPWAMRRGDVRRAAGAANAATRGYGGRWPRPTRGATWSTRPAA